MKNILLSMMTMFLLTVSSQNVQLKSITEVKFNVNNEPVFKIIKEFNKDSLLIKSSYYSGSELSSFITYSAIVNQESTEISYNKNSEIQEMDTIRYDKDGEIIYYSRKHPLRDESANFYVDKYRFEYDENHNIIKEFREENGNSGGWVYDYEYDDKNQKIKMFSSYNDLPREEYIFFYKKGKLVETKLYDYNNDERMKRDNTYWFYKYKKGKRVSKEVHSVADYLKKTIINLDTYSYNKDGYLKEVTISKDGVYDGKKTYSYTFH